MIDLFHLSVALLLWLPAPKLSGSRLHIPYRDG